MKDFMGQPLSVGDWIIIDIGHNNSLQLAKITGFYYGKKDKVEYYDYYKKNDGFIKRTWRNKPTRRDPYKVVKYRGYIKEVENDN